MSILTETAPRKIYLCISDDEDHHDEPWPERYQEDEEITWSVDQPVACTVEYVRADLHEEVKLQRDSLAAEVDRLRELLLEARESWIKVGYGASHEDVIAFRDLCERIDAALTVER